MSPFTTLWKVSWHFLTLIILSPLKECLLRYMGLANLRVGQRSEWQKWLVKGEVQRDGLQERWVTGELRSRNSSAGLSYGLSENELAGLDRLAPNVQERISASDTPVHSEDIASAVALGGWAAGCVEAMGRLSGDGGCQAKYTQAVSRWDSLSKNYSSVNN